MSIHPSLTATKGKKHRSVLKRFERIQELQKTGKWAEEKSVFGLPKGKVIKIKLKKTKSAEAKKPEETATDKDASSKKTASK